MLTQLELLCKHKLPGVSPFEPDSEDALHSRSHPPVATPSGHRRWFDAGAPFLFKNMQELSLQTCFPSCQEPAADCRGPRTAKSGPPRGASPTHSDVSILPLQTSSCKSNSIRTCRSYLYRALMPPQVCSSTAVSPKHSSSTATGSIRIAAFCHMQ